MSAAAPPRALEDTWPEQAAGDVEVSLARGEDDRDIRALLAATAVEGPIALTYEREPSYFLGCPIMGRRVETLVARLRETGELVGLASRSVRPLWVNGTVQDVGYLGHLRVSPRYRGRSLVQRGFRLLHSLDRFASIPGYLTTIVEGNAEAMGVLVRRARPDMPSYRERARVRTLVIPTRGRRWQGSAEMAMGDGDTCDVTEVVNYLQRAGASRQFFPYYQLSDFLAGSPSTRGFDPRNFIVTRRDGAITGVLGVWDQSGFKQVVVRGYRGLLARVRPIVSLAAPVLGYPSLPRAPAALRIAYASFLAVDGDRGDTFEGLLHAALSRAARLGCGYLTLALAENDPLLATALPFRHRAYASRLFTVDWRGGAFHDEVASGVPYVDIASF